jgi:LuxR family maltose regulon positive regulatory protein
MRAWVESGAGAFRAARATVGPLLRAPARAAWPGTVVEAWLVVANAGLETGDRVGARQALRTALDCARPLDVVRPFVRAPAAVQALLVDELVATDGRGRFAGRVLAAPQHEAASAAVVLTARESDVLARLPSLLNLEEIAGDLAVSVNTVKSHVRSIYDKLGAGTRRSAVLAAHERGLLR